MDACTIISSNFLPFARAMVKSYRRYHPEGRFFVLVIDRRDDTDFSEEPWETIYSDELGLGEELPRLAMLYDAYEMSMSLRPAFVLHLMREKNVENLVMMDSDLYFTGRLEGTEELLEKHAISICVSIREPIPEDGCRPQDDDFILAGTLNGGFVLVRRCDETIRAMEWLWSKLRKLGFYRPYEGLFGDQKWLDLWPSFMDTLGVVKTKGWNVCHWNIHERPLSKENGVLLAGGDPVIFYHFSGFRPDQPDIVSAHENRYGVSIPGLKELADIYRAALKANGYDEWKEKEYGWNRFENGVKVSPCIRRAYEEVRGPKRFPRPHESGEGSFLWWLRLPCRGSSPINNLHMAIWRMSLEARGRFPDPTGRDIGRFAKWILHERGQELGLDPTFTGSLGAIPNMRGASLREYVRMLLALRHVFGPYQALCRFVKKRIGTDLYDRMKPRRSREFGEARFRLQQTPERPEGITMLSAVGAENGVAEGARALVKAFRSAGIKTEHIDSRTAPGRQDLISPLRKLHWYDTTILSGGAEEIGRIVSTNELVVGPNQRVIACMPWESQLLPKNIRDGLNAFYEVWTSSTFSASALRRHLTTPVCVLPYPVDVSAAAPMSRADLGLREGTFAVLFIFDFHSEVQRKNPHAVIDAFVRAFGNDPSAELLIVGTHADAFPKEARELRSIVAAESNVRLSETYRSRPEILGAIRACDCYLSLHRAEGFGLTIAEAMALGVPTAATDFGGSTDFLSERTGWPIRCRRFHLRADCGPYPAGTEWADADIDAAAAALKEIRGNPTEARNRSLRASALMRDEYAPEVVGRKAKLLLKR